MPLKSNVTKLNKRIQGVLPDGRAAIAKELKAEIVDIIVEQITSGLSPVKGQNRYPRYSEKYSEIKGRKQPVDLVRSGDMLGNMRARITKKNSIIIEFPDKEQRDKAEGHQFGANGLPIRKILPVGRGEVFKEKILDKIIRIAQKAINETVKKTN